MHHYSKSEGLNIRTASAVCQKNIGQTCMTNNTVIDLSPRKINHKFSSQQEKVKLKMKEKRSAFQFKKRHLQLKESRSSDSRKQLREGVAH